MALIDAGNTKISAGETFAVSPGSAEVSGKSSLSLAKEWGSLELTSRRSIRSGGSAICRCNGAREAYLICAMENIVNATRSCCFAIIALLLSATVAAAQFPPPSVIPPTPNLNPSAPLVLPPPHQVPVSPSPGGGGGTSVLNPYHSVCSVFRHKPCFPYYWPPIGQDLRLTIVSTDENTSQSEKGEGVAADEHPLDSIREMFAALRACWVPPPKEGAHHGMEYTIRFAFKRDGTMIAPPRVTYSSHDAPADTRNVYRDAIDAALKRCTPLHFSDGMAGAVAGRPIAIRFVDDRTIDQQQNLR